MEPLEHNIQELSQKEVKPAEILGREEYFRIVQPKILAVCEKLSLEATNQGDELLSGFIGFAEGKNKLALHCFNFWQHVEPSSGDNPKVFNMVKSALLLNLETFKYAEKQELVNFIAAHPELAEIISEKWNGAKDFLYNPQLNDVRERFRESVIGVLREDIEAGRFDPNSLEHLERFLPMMQGASTTEESLNLYLKSVQCQIMNYASLDMADFRDYLLSHISDSGLPIDDQFLRQIEEELSSIKKRNLQAADLKINYKDRQEKLRLVRDLRFGRMMFESLAEPAAKKEMSEDPDYNVVTGKCLRQHKKAFDVLVQGSRDLAPAERLSQLTGFLENSGLESTALEPLRTLMGEYFG